MKCFKKVITIVAVSFALYFITGCSSAFVGQSDNSQEGNATYRGNNERTGVYDSGPVKLSGIKWRFKTEGKEVSSTPAVSDGVVYFGSKDYNLYAVEVESGKEKWRFGARGTIASSPAVADGTVYFGSGDGYLYAVDVNTGAEKWRFETEAAAKEFKYRGTSDANLKVSRKGVSSSPAIAEKVVYFGSTGGKLYALDSETGQKKWEYDAQEPIRESPAVYGGMVCFTGVYNFYAVDSMTGQERWRFGLGDRTTHTTPAVADGLVYFSFADENNGNIYAFDINTGQQRWICGKGELGTSFDFLAVDSGTLYFGDIEGMHAVDAKSGVNKWDYKVKGGAMSPPVIAGDTLYFGNGKNVIALDVVSGGKLAQFKTETKLYFSSLAIFDEVAYVGGDNGYLYAIQ